MSERVRVYDCETKRVIAVPVSELLPDMIKGRVDGVEGEVYINGGARLEETVRAWGVVQQASQVVWDWDFGNWDEGFKRDDNPQRQMVLWLKIAACYLYFTKGRKLGHERKREVLEVVIALFNGVKPATTMPPHEVAAMQRQIKAGVAQGELDQLLRKAGQVSK
ncbi:MAG: hypothetical protein ACYCW6_31150 [Candidatus Xenobia bacterium]